ncbi:MAG TPA: type IV secretion system protein [Rhizomicrobium sp.]|jgi:type IV secretion system protein VirB6
MSGCSTVTDLGVVRDVLATVDCNTRTFARLGYESLAAANSPFQTALTIALTIYVAVIGYRLLFGEGAHLSDGPVIALKIGAVLALVTSWSLFQTLVFDLAERAPAEIAAVISAPMRGGHSLAADPLSGLQASYDHLSQAAIAFAHPPKSVDEHVQADSATAAQALDLAANGLFISSAGLISVLLIAIGLLTATGPLFIAMFLFFETRGLFVGWVRALAASAFGLLSAWSLTILMLHAAEPWLDALGEVGANGMADPHTGITTAIIVLVFAAAQVGLLLAGIMIARGFRLPSRAPRATSQTTLKQTALTAAMPLDMISRPARLAEQLSLHQDTQSVYGERTYATAASVTYTRREGSGPAPAIETRIGDSYRRPAVRREGRHT